VGLIEMITCAIMAIFALSGAAAMASVGTCPPGSQFCNNYNAAEAFSWLTWLAWSAGTVICLLEWLKGPKPLAGAGLQVIRWGGSAGSGDGQQSAVGMRQSSAQPPHDTRPRFGRTCR
jgi:hypothetical protein